MIFIDSDNAMGSRWGDVDDAFAIDALLRGGAPVAGLSSCAGNTSEPRAFENNRRLAAHLGWTGPLLRADEARRALASFEGRVAALGPLTNVVDARRAAEIVIVGGNSATRGHWPPLFPHEFNLTFDRAAAHAVFALDVPLTIFPLNIARRLWVRRDDLPPGYLRDGARRWFRRLRLLKLTGRFPIYDLAAALYLLGEEGFAFEQTTARMHRNTFLEFGRGTRAVKVCTALEREVVLRRAGVSPASRGASRAAEPRASSPGETPGG